MFRDQSREHSSAVSFNQPCLVIVEEFRIDPRRQHPRGAHHRAHVGGGPEGVNFPWLNGNHRISWVHSLGSFTRFCRNHLNSW